LKSLPEVTSARGDVTSAKAKVAQLTSALASAPQSSKAGVKAQLDSAQAELDSANSKFTKIESDAKTYYRNNTDEIKKKAAAKTAGESFTNLEEAKATRDRLAAAGQDTTLADRAIAKLEGKISSGFQESPAPGGLVTDQSTASGVETKPEDFAGLLKTARKFIKDKDAASRLEIAKSLRAAGDTTVPLTGEFTEALVTSYKNAISGANAAWSANKEFASVSDYLNDQIRQAKAIAASGGGDGTPTATVSDKTEANYYVRNAFKTVLGRDPSADELTKYSGILQSAQKKSLKRTVNGVTTGGLGSPTEFLTEEIQKLPEYATKKAEKVDVNKQDVLKLLQANGLPTNQDQVNSWATAIQNGTSLDTIGKQIRQIAGAGLPDNIKNLLAQGINLDTVYSPYKSTMASTLELNPNDIKLNDPTLRLALGPDKEMSIYDFQKILKKDNRWQYTTNAKEEISNSVQKVLQDFGFKG
jgi:hypothetical protein